MLFNWSIQAISECCRGGKKECWKLFIDVVRPEYDEMLSVLSTSRRVWKSFVFSSCFFLFQHVTHALSGFSRLSHENVEHFDREREEKSFSSWLIDAFFSDFDFYCYSFVVWRQEKNLNQTVLCYFTCFSFCMRIKRIIRKKFRLYFSLFTESFNIYGVSLRRVNSLHDNVTQCDAGTRQREKKNQDIIIFFEWCIAETTSEKK